MARMTQYSLVLIVLLLHGRVCLGGNCYCFNADELTTNDRDDDSHKKCLSSCSTCSENYVFLYKFNVSESCVGRCGHRLDRSLDCQCNVQCKEHNDCCEDYDAFCLESCVGRCKQRHNDRDRCQCDTDCKENNDCCRDYNAFCSEETMNIETFDDAPQFCPDHGSFIKWDPLTSCINFDQKIKHRTGKTSSRETLRSTAFDENDEWKALQCKRGETSEDLLLVKLSSFECSDLVSFYCRNGSSPQKSITTVKSQENNFITPIEPGQITPQNKSNTMTGVIVGIVLSIIAIGVVIFVVIVIRRRRSAIRNPILKQDVHGPNDTEKIEHLENKNGYAYSEIEMETTNKKDYINNGDNEYTTGTSDVYDHLNENKNRKIKTENPHAIYDHSIGDNAEPDYDSTKHVVPTNPEYQEVRIRSEEESHSEKL